MCRLSTVGESSIASNCSVFRLVGLESARGGVSGRRRGGRGRERAYFRANAARMAYPTFRARGFPIGSGAVESAARHVIQQHTKLPGVRWGDDGGRAIATLRAHLRSDRPLVA